MRWQRFWLVAILLGAVGMAVPAFNAPLLRLGTAKGHSGDATAPDHAQTTQPESAPADEERPKDVVVNDGRRYYWYDPTGRISILHNYLVAESEGSQLTTWTDGASLSPGEPVRVTVILSSRDPSAADAPVASVVCTLTGREGSNRRIEETSRPSFRKTLFLREPRFKAVIENSFRSAAHADTPEPWPPIGRYMLDVEVHLTDGRVMRTTGSQIEFAYGVW